MSSEGWQPWLPEPWIELGTWELAKVHAADLILL